MIKFLIVITLAACNISAGAQQTYRQKLYAYKAQQGTTNIFIADTIHNNTSSSHTNYMIYLELPERDTPIWKTAVIGNDIYTVHATTVKENPLFVGERKLDNIIIKIRPQPANRLWKLEFDVTDEKLTATDNAADGTVILKGAFKNKKVT